MSGAHDELTTRLGLALDGAGLGLWEWDIAGARCRVDARASAIYRGTVPADRWCAFAGPEMAAWRLSMHPDDVATRDEAAEALLNGRAELRAFTYRAQVGDGGWFWISSRSTVTARGPDGRASRILGVIQDVTEQRMALARLEASEAALRQLTGELEARVRDAVAAREAAQMTAAHAGRMQALGKLAGGVAHDFSNVLQAVGGAATLLERHAGEPAEVARIAGLIAGATERGAAVTRRLLAFARRDALRSEPVEPSVLAATRDILTLTIDETVAMRVEVAHDTPSVLVDRAQLESVLVNLANNARDAMPDGGTLTLAAAPGADGLVLVSIADTGVGMDADTLARASEPFFTTKPAGVGTGLGLAMARDFCEQSGGRLTIDSVLGRGTTVSLWLPAAPLPEIAA